MKNFLTEIAIRRIFGLPFEEEITYAFNTYVPNSEIPSITSITDLRTDKLYYVPMTSVLKMGYTSEDVVLFFIDSVDREILENEPETHTILSLKECEEKLHNMEDELF